MKVTRRQFVEAASAFGAVGALELSGCVHPRNIGKSAQAPPAAATLREAGAARGILAGCAVQVRRLHDTPEYAALVRAQAGILVEETAFKFGPLRPTPTTYFFDNADALVEFAEANGMKVRGHNFAWHRQLPAWFAGYVTPRNAEQVLVEHIERVAGRYAGKIHSWDVVNEAIRVEDGLPGGMRNTPWYQVLPNYIDIAYRTTRRVDPSALLVYNDYDIEGEDAASAKKRAAVLELLRGMQQRGVPVDGLGIQSHIAVGTGPAREYGPGLRAMMAEARGMGLKLLLTEMDVNDRALPAPIEQRDKAVGEVYASYLKTTLADPGVIALLTWGITDRYTWLDHQDARKDGLPERPLPFDENMQPTPAFFAERKALEDAPMRG